MYSAVSVISPPQVEPLTIQQVQQHCRIDNNYDNTLLAMYLTSARMAVELFLGRALITQTLQWSMARTPPSSQYPLFPFTAFIFPLWMPYSMLFQRPIELPRSPVQSIVSVAMGSWGEPDVVLTPDQYDCDTATEPARLQIYAGAGDFPSDHTIVQFIAGYGPSGANVPMPILHAILMMCAFYNERRGDDGGAMPEAVKNLLWPYRLTFFGTSDA